MKWQLARTWFSPAIVVAQSLAAACGPETQAPPQAKLAVASEPPRFDEQHLQTGREIWMGSCRGCHDIGVAGAPRLGDLQVWAPRIAKGIETLHDHAVHGFFGPKGTMMPPRGGNDALSDRDVMAAVDYMLAASGGPR